MQNREEIPGLVAEIKAELLKLKTLAGKLSVQKGRTDEEEVAESAALRLHNFYNGCERIFKLIASEINGGVPHELDWHRRLLLQISLEIEGVRPAVISRETARDLEELLRFRHIVRNIYGFELEAERIEALISLSTDLYDRFADEIDKFIHFLKSIHRSM